MRTPDTNGTYCKQYRFKARKKLFSQNVLQHKNNKNGKVMIALNNTIHENIFQNMKQQEKDELTQMNMRKVLEMLILIT